MYDKAYLKTYFNSQKLFVLNLIENKWELLKNWIIYI